MIIDTVERENRRGNFIVFRFASQPAGRPGGGRRLASSLPLAAARTPHARRTHATGTPQARHTHAARTRTLKGQIISKCLLGVIIWTKIATKKFDNFCPGGQIKKIEALFI